MSRLHLEKFIFFLHKLLICINQNENDTNQHQLVLRDFATDKNKCIQIRTIDFDMFSNIYLGYDYKKLINV